MTEPPTGKAGHFEPIKHSEDELDPRWDDRDRAAEAKKQARLPRTLAEIARAVADAALCTSAGQEAFRADRRLQLAGEAVLGHVGESVNRLPQSFTDANADLPWRQIGGMRNRVVHEYQLVSLDILWSALAKDLPEFGRALELRSR